MSEYQKNIVWIASYPKSGNTWFRIFLQNLYNNSDLPASINDLNISMLASSRVLLDNYAGVDSSDLTEEEIEKIRPEVYKKISAENSDLVFFKVHDAWKLNRHLEEIFPEEITKTVIYIVRNPLEVAVSFAHHSNGSIQDYVNKLNDEKFSLCEKSIKLHNQIKQSLLNWSKHIESWTELSNLPVHVIRYEDMQLRSHETFTKAVKILDLNYSISQIKQAIINSNIQTIQKQEKDDGFNEKQLEAVSFFRSGTNKSWKKLLSKGDIFEITSKNERLMKRFEYI